MAFEAKDFNPFYPISTAAIFEAFPIPEVVDFIVEKPKVKHERD